MRATRHLALLALPALPALLVSLGTACGRFGEADSARVGDAGTGIAPEAGTDRTDASAGADAPPTPTVPAFCAAQAQEALVFCDSFDSGNFDGWERDDDTTTAIAHDTVRFLSAPRAARCELRRGATGQSQDARLRRSFSLSHRWVELRGAFRVEARGTDPLAFVVLATSEAVYRIRSDGSVNRTTTATSATEPGILRFGAIATERFVPFLVRVDRMAKSLVVTIDGVEKEAETPELGDLGTFVNIGVGPAESNDGGGWSILYDDIVVHAGP